MNFLFFELQINSNTCKTCVPKMEKIKFEIECSYVGVTVQPGCPLYFCFYDRVIFFVGLHFLKMFIHSKPPGRRLVRFNTNIFNPVLSHSSSSDIYY